ncbi:MAG: tandem-95 repeat protein [Desulfobacteraceae bacterium]|nr:tandem-95 repeat protein [Desulfobacteraceae bacterium]
MFHAREMLIYLPAMCQLPDTYSTDEDTPLTVSASGVLTNDADTESDPLSASKLSDPLHGLLILNSDGSFTYTPEADWNGTDSFTYKAGDGSTDSGAATATVTVSAVNDAPAAGSDKYTTDEDTALTVEAPGILANDTDTEGASLTVSEFTEPSNGSLELNSDGSFTYTPKPDWNGTDTFTYKAGDGSADSETASAEITVTAVDDPPYAAKLMPDINAQMNSDDMTAYLTGIFSDTDSDDSAIAVSVFSNSNPLLVSANISGNALTLAFAPNEKGEAVIVIRGTSEGKTADNEFTVTVGDATDTDNDGMPDWWEKRHGFNIADPGDANRDTDNDGLSNLSEFVSMTDPSDPDSDNDGATDGNEISKNSDPHDSSAVPGTEPADSDKDGIPDWWEKIHGLDPDSRGDASDDPDRDGLTNLEEFFIGTAPRNPDTDGDGAGDGDETENEDNPLNPIRVTAFTGITDENGGSPMPGDEIEFEITLANESSAPIKGAQLEIPFPGYTVYTEGSINSPEGSAVSEDDSSLLVTGIDIPAHGQVSVRFTASVDATGTVLPLAWKTSQCLCSPWSSTLTETALTKAHRRQTLMLPNPENSPEKFRLSYLPQHAFQTG